MVENNNIRYNNMNCMLRKLLIIITLLTFSTSSYSQRFGSLSGTIRFSGGALGAGMVFSPTYLTWLLYEGFSDKGYGGNIDGWIRDNHLSFLRFLNVGYDFVFPQWEMNFSNNEILIDRMYASDDNTFDADFFTNEKYINYIGYYLNWKDPFSRWGGYCGVDYELRKFSLEYKSNASQSYHYWRSKNEIHSLVPSVGLRYRLISPEKEIEGFPLNVVLEAGLSYACVIDYKNEVTSTDHLIGYDTGALNNGIRVQLGIVLTTNKWGSLNLRWNKDLYDLYNNDNISTISNGCLYNNTVINSFSCFSIGWATFL